MFVFSRIVGESLIIGDGYEVTVVRITMDDVGLVVRNLMDGSENSAVHQRGERMMLRENVCMTVIDIQITAEQKKVRFGIELPRGIGVWRKELRPET